MRENDVTALGWTCVKADSMVKWIQVQTERAEATQKKKRKGHFGFESKIQHPTHLLFG